MNKVKLPYLYVLDSNFIIRASYGENPEHHFIKQTLATPPLTAHFIIPTIVVAEVLTQVNAVEQEYLLAFLEISQVVDLDLSLAQKAAQLRKQSLKKKKSYLLDCVVAAVAIEKQATLLTNNIKDYTNFDLEIKSF